MKRVCTIIIPVIGLISIVFLSMHTPIEDLYFADDFLKYLNHIMLDEDIVFDLEQFTSNSLILSTGSNVSENQKQFIPVIINEALNGFVSKASLSDEIILFVKFYKDNTSIQYTLVLQNQHYGIESIKYADGFDE